MIIRIYLHFFLAGLSVLMSHDSFSQKLYNTKIDSLMNSGMVQKTAQFFYVKPIFEQYQSLVSTQGDGFSSPKGDLVRKRGFGIRIGYGWKAFELETGLSTIRPAAGYRYILAGSTGYTTRTISTDFYHMPIIFRFRFWQPIRNLSLRIGAGVAYNIDLNKFPLATGGISEESTQDANGNRIILARTRDQYEQKKSFYSGELNLSAHYRVSSHFSINIEGRRLFGPMDAVRSTATQQTFNPPSFRTVEARGGTNSLSINLGLVYQFRLNNRYELSSQNGR